MKDLNELTLHDSYIAGIEVETNYDHFDRIVIKLESEMFLKDFGKDRIQLIFENCFKAKFNLQMWISGKDSVRNHSILCNSDWLNELHKIHDQGFLPKFEEFKHFVLELNTSNSVIEILSKNISLK